MPSDAYMRQYSRPSLVQIMASRLFGTKHLMVAYLSLDLWDKIEAELELKYKNSHATEFIWECRHFVSASAC